MKAEQTRKALEISLNSDDGLAISYKWYDECTSELDQLESDAELGRAVRKAFSQAYNVNPSHGYVRGALLNEEMLIEWSEGIEDENR